MPPKRPRMVRHAEVDPMRVFGPGRLLNDAPKLSEEEVESAYWAAREELIEEYRDHRPGTRPPAFWALEAPGICDHEPRCEIPPAEIVSTRVLTGELQGSFVDTRGLERPNTGHYTSARGRIESYEPNDQALLDWLERHGQISVRERSALQRWQQIGDDDEGFLDEDDDD